MPVLGAGSGSSGCRGRAQTPSHCPPELWFPHCREGTLHPCPMGLVLPLGSSAAWKVRSQEGGGKALLGPSGRKDAQEPGMALKVKNRGFIQCLHS